MSCLSVPCEFVTDSKREGGGTGERGGGGGGGGGVSRPAAGWRTGCSVDRPSKVPRWQEVNVY